LTLQLIQELFEDADLYGYKKAGADATIYDKAAEQVFKRLSSDLSVEQICKIIWDACYWDFCFATLGNSNEYWALGKKQALPILGEASRFVGIAKNIRHILYKL
jgi:hypothetical protein